MHSLFDNPTFVGYLTAAKSHGSKCLESATSTVFRGCERRETGDAGRTVSRDVEALDKS